MKPLILCLFTFVNLTIFAQSSLEMPNEKSIFDTELISKNNIRSLTVYAEFDEGKIEKLSDDAVRMRMFEFDKNGYLVYHLENNNTVLLELAKGKEKRIELTLHHYNDDNLNVYTCVENEGYMAEYFFGYDRNKNLSESESMFNEETFEKFKFKWRKGKMVRSKVIYTDDGEEVTYNEDGRISECVFDDDRYLYKYLQNDDTSSYIESRYHLDTLASIKHYSYLREEESQMTHFLLLNGAGMKRREVFVQYDEKGNKTDYRFQNFEKRFLNEKDYVIDNPIIYEIKNEYDERGLLVKQIFYLKDTFAQQLKLNKILYYVYETAPLEFKIERGSIEKRHSNIQLR